MEMKLAVILYTVRDQLAQDFDGTLAKVAEMGYRNVQVSGMPADKTPRQIQDALEKHGLNGFAPHLPVETFMNDFDKVVEACNAYGTKHAVLPYISEDYYKDGWRMFAEFLIPLGKKCRENGLQLSYHNHSFEFGDEGGRPGYDVLIESTDPDLVHFEVDTYWVDHGGGNPAEYIRRLKGRVPMVHAKDRPKEGKDYPFEEVGAGTLDWDDILAASKEAGAEFITVELDKSPRNPLESIKASREFLKSKGLSD
jgi:sugar phosphate isomerase/epimerase